jgi:rubrerythrin
MDTRFHRQRLISILQHAYSGECAAAYAYRGHWKSVEQTAERERIRQIENEEWAHRDGVGRMLAHLGARPRRILEVKLWLIGHAIGAACHVTGWFAPMYFAGRLEHGNVDEYLQAARHAAALGLDEFAAALARMAEVEREHELFFMNTVTGHRLLPLAQALFKWGQLPGTLISAPLRNAQPPSINRRRVLKGDKAGMLSSLRGNPCTLTRTRTSRAKTLTATARR